MRWTDFTTSLAFRSLGVSPMDDTSPHTSKSAVERWDPSLHNFNVETSSRGNLTFTNMHQPPVFSTEETTSAGHMVIGTAVTDSNSPTPHASATSHLAAPSSVGASSTKVSKKRSRASRRPPTTVLEADSSNFRSMVQHLTGIPAPPPMLSPYHHHHFLGSPGLVRPQPSRPLGYNLETPAGALLQYQSSPYSNSRREDQFRGAIQYGGGAVSRVTPGSFSDPMNSSNLQYQGGGGVLGVKSTSGTTSGGGGGGGGGFYVGQEGNSTGLLMPSLWELETREGGSFNARVKREVGVEESGSGRQIASSWSSSL